MIFSNMNVLLLLNYPVYGQLGCPGIRPFTLLLKIPNSESVPSLRSLESPEQ